MERNGLKSPEIDGLIAAATAARAEYSGLVEERADRQRKLADLTAQQARIAEFVRACDEAIALGSAPLNSGQREEAQDSAVSSRPRQKPSARTCHEPAAGSSTPRA